jgi:hypothetical protein
VDILQLSGTMIIGESEMSENIVRYDPDVPPPVHTT